LRINAHWIAFKTRPVGSGADRFIADDRGVIVADMLALLAEFTTPQQTLAVLPEGTIFNYLARRATSTPIVQLNPTELVIFGEQDLTQGFEDHPPSFILLVHKDTTEFGARYFGIDYGRPLLDWIKRHYHPLRRLGATPLVGPQFGMLLLRHESVPPRRPAAFPAGATGSSPASVGRARANEPPVAPGPE
jgi:hypothetical protein